MWRYLAGLGMSMEGGNAAAGLVGVDLDALPMAPSIISDSMRI
jgi:hypothetical protein